MAGKNVVQPYITTPEAARFWASRNICNKLKAIIAFSPDDKAALNNLRLYGFRRGYRELAVKVFGQYAGKPGMETVPFTNGACHLWDEEAHMQVRAIIQYCADYNHGDHNICAAIDEGHLIIVGDTLYTTKAYSLDDGLLLSEYLNTLGAGKPYDKERYTTAFTKDIMACYNDGLWHDHFKWLDYDKWVEVE